MNRPRLFPSTLLGPHAAQALAPADLLAAPTSRSQVRRALLGLCLTAATTFAAPPASRPWPSEPPFQAVTAERIAQLPGTPQAEWRAYWEASQALAAQLPPRPAFATPSLERLQGAGIPSKHSRGLQIAAAKDWYATEAAQTIADRVVAAQTGAGGWVKGNDYTVAKLEPHEPDIWSTGTFDNDATIWELRSLALVATAVPQAPHAAEWQEAFRRGLRFIFAAQYPHGGFPQVYPLAGGYHDAVTFNDDAMVQALGLLRDIAGGRPEFAFLPAAIRTECGVRVARGVTCILAAQFKDAQGNRTAWCQQHDALTLQACAARNFEPVAVCTNESTSLVRFLMAMPSPSPEIVAAIRGAIGWFERTGLKDVAFSRAGGVGRLVARPGAPTLWARMYEPGTNLAVFGDRDRTVHYAFDELSSERKNGYAWYGTWPSAALVEYRSWSAKQK